MHSPSSILVMDFGGLRKVISGGQDGVDRGGIDAARNLGVETGGTAPKGWRVQNGFDPSLKDLGLVEHPSALYPPRTLKNVRDADGTLIIASNFNSAGTALTIRYCNQERKPFHLTPLPWWPLNGDVDAAVNFIVSNGIGILNVAGNAEKKSKGPTYHHDMAQGFVEAVLHALRHEGLLVSTQR